MVLLVTNVNIVDTGAYSAESILKTEFLYPIGKGNHSDPLMARKTSEFLENVKKSILLPMNRS